MLCDSAIKMTTATIMSASTSTSTSTSVGNGCYGEVTTYSPGWVVKTAIDPLSVSVLTQEAWVYASLHTKTTLCGRVTPRLDEENSTEEKLVIEHVQGRTLLEIALNSPSKYLWHLALCHVSGVLSAFHAEGWVHGDMHPGNVIVSVAGARLIDLSTAIHPIEGRLEYFKNEDRKRLRSSLEYTLMRLPPWMWEAVEALI